MIFIEADLNKDLNGSSKHTCDLQITKKTICNNINLIRSNLRRQIRAHHSINKHTALSHPK